MPFRKIIEIAINIKVKKIQGIISKTPQTTKIIQNKSNHTPILKHKYSNFWRFHHGDEL